MRHAPLLLALALPVLPSLAAAPAPTEAAPAPAALSTEAPPAPEALSEQAWSFAQEAFRCARTKGTAHGTVRPDVLAVIDYSLPSDQRRLWVVDPRTGEVRFHERVAHGKNSGMREATAFSNRDGSHTSSLGVFRAAETYVGKHGRSLRLDGLEPGVNDKARDRAIVIHGAAYASEAFVAEHGRLGRSYGCPSLDPAVAQEVIDTLADGALIVAWYPDEAWTAGSPFAACDG